MDLTRTAFGAWGGGRFMHYGEALSEDRLVEVIRHSHEQGIRTFVTADVYGAGRADEIMGEALSVFPRDSYCLVGAIGHDFVKGVRAGSKGYPRFTDPELHSEAEYLDYMTKATSDSAKRCGVDAFDLLMLHNPDHRGYTSETVWNGMASLKEAGLAERIGIAPGPANGFSVDMIDCFKNYGELIDWAMVILNPMEPWPGRLVLGPAEQAGIKVLTRVVDYGGLFHGDVLPGHVFKDGDHRNYRPEGWVDTAYEKIGPMKEMAEASGLTLLQFACQWNLAQPAVECVVPTLIQENGETARPIEDKIKELATLPEEIKISAEHLARAEEIGDNEGCMVLKGASSRHEGNDPLPDQWAMRPELLAIAESHGINPSW